MSEKRVIGINSNRFRTLR